MRSEAGGERGHHPSYLPRTQAAQKRLTHQQGQLRRSVLKQLQAARPKVLRPGAGNAQVNGAKAGQKITLIVAVARILSRLGLALVTTGPAVAVALPFRLQLEKSLPGQLRLPIQISPKPSFDSLRKCWKCSVERRTEFLRSTPVAQNGASTG